MKLFRKVAKHIEMPARSKIMIEHGAVMMRCGWCEKDTPVYQPINKTDGGGTGCQQCGRTVDSFYRDWVYRAEFSDGCTLIEYLSGGKTEGGPKHAAHSSFMPDDKPIKEWHRSEEEATQYTLPEIDYKTVLSDFPTEFQLFFNGTLEAIEAKESYYTGGSKSLRSRWHYEKLPQWVYALWREEDYNGAIAKICDTIPEHHGFSPVNPFLTPREHVIIENITRILTEKAREEDREMEESDDPIVKHQRLGASCTLHRLSRRIANLSYLESSFIPEGEFTWDKKRNKRLTTLIEKHRDGFPVECHTDELSQIMQSDLDELMDDCWGQEAEYYFDVYVQWSFTDRIRSYSITDGFMGKLFRTYTYNGKMVTIDRPFEKVGIKKSQTKMWLIGQSLSP